ncbi:hypothetical protein MesoLjLc_45750 [Mesorhizobium sp. L-8-10]|uniref:hypothetical protein n=1 Tax=Mesorhizobium sp. L-8-10 TaxID=2744523 RepID=UPI0019258BA4|nr:hypothetical protein [Mesorhizobium sp. L-8-10]BCH32645.1 hypothetical protein MesoLjLc_45750 [Mesorhizobium sp. L-8-10]
MPGVIESFVLLGLTSLGVSGAALGIATATLTYGLIGGIGIGLQLLAQSIFRPQAPKPEDVQTSVRQPAQPRSRHYGKAKISGPWVFAESKDGTFFKILALGQGPIDGFEEYWIDDEQVTLNGSGGVISGPKANITIATRTGVPTETAYGISTEFPEWTSAHRGDGVASLLAVQPGVDSEVFFEKYPNGINTNYRVVIRGCRVFNPATETTVWNDRAAAVIRDYMTHADGMRLPTSIFSTPLAAAGWLAAYHRCNENITLKAGGTEARYRLWGSYFLNERPGDVLGRMLACCDGRLYPTPDGGLTLNVGGWQEPTVILDEDAIVGFTELSRGKDIITTANVIRATYLGVDQDYQTADADPWIDVADVAGRGEIERDIPFVMSPAHGQTRRLMKKEAYRANPNWVGTFQFNLRGLAALGERLVRIRYPLFGIDEVFEVQDFQFILGDDGILQGVMMPVISMPAASEEWNPATEEGDAPASTQTDVDRTIPVPTGFSVAAVHLNVEGAPLAIARLTFDAPPVASLKVQARGKKTSESQWTPIPVQSGATQADSFPLDDGVEYEFQIRHISPSGRPSAWTASELLTAYGDPVAPGALTGVSVNGGLGRATLAFTAPGSNNLDRVKIYRRATVGTPGEGDLIAVLNVSQLAAYNYTDGDATRTNLLLTPDFASDTNWTKGTGWTIGSGVASHASGSASLITQTPSMSAGQNYRIGYQVTAISGGDIRSRIIGDTAPDGTVNTTVGQKLDTIAAPTTPVTFGLRASATAVVSVDNAILFQETASCAPQGVWQYYVKPVNRSGLGNPQGPYQVTVF